MWNVGPNARREKGDDACMGFMGLLGVGVHMHQVGYAQSVEPTSPIGNHCNGGSVLTNWHATCVLKLYALARAGPTLKNF